MAKKTGHIDWVLFLPIVALMLFSIAFVYSASVPYAQSHNFPKEYFFREHAIRILLGLTIIIIFSKIDYHKFESFAKISIIISIILLLMVLVMGMSEKGAARWLGIRGFFRFQPSEFVKLSVILYISVYLIKNQEIIKDFQAGLVPALSWVGFVCLLIALQPNFSTTILIFVVSITLLYLGNANKWHLLSTLFLGIAAASIYAVSISKYPIARIQSFLGGIPGNGSEFKVSHQVEQALIALGTGGFFGLGPGHSKQNLLFLPESYGDFIFSIIGEEYGFIGVLLVITAFVIIIWRGLKIVKNTPDDFGFYLSAGITLNLGLNALINLCVNTNLFPATGLPMPFISFGGTAVFFYSAAAGILLNISTHTGLFPKKA